jgi:hypothetical protein
MHSPIFIPLSRGIQEQEPGDSRYRKKWTASGFLCAGKSPHPKPFAVRHADDFAAFGTKIDVSSPEETFEWTAPHFCDFLGTMRANRIHVVFLFNRQHKSLHDLEQKIACHGGFSPPVRGDQLVGAKKQAHDRRGFHHPGRKIEKAGWESRHGHRLGAGMPRAVMPFTCSPPDA